MTEEDFHRARRMFALKPDGVLVIAGLNDIRSHARWFTDMGWHDALEHWPRGYYNGTGIYIYQGADFRSVDFGNVTTICKRLRSSISDVYYDDVEVFNGMIKEDFVGRWHGRIRCGKLRALMGNVA